MKRTFVFLFSLVVLCWSMSHSQEPTSAIIGDELFPSGAAFAPQGQTIIDAQLYMPETFSQTDVIPTDRERESLTDYTNTVQSQQPIFWGGIAFAGQYGQFDKLPYTDIYISPYLQIWKIFLMYEAPLRFDWNGAFVSKMWNSKAALLSKIFVDFYLSKTDSVFRHFHVSIYDNETTSLGHGRFFYDYNPNLYSPYEPFKTVKLSLDVSYIGLEYILANIADPTLTSAELYIRPLQGLKNPKYAHLKDFKIYGVYGIDLNPFHGYSPDLYEFANNELSPIFQMFEFGVDIPIYKTDNNIFAISIYGDYTHFIGTSNDYFTIEEGSGISAGVLMNVFEKMPIRFEISQAIGYWQPRWVNIFYYIDSPYIVDGANVYDNKYMTITPDLTYFTGSIGFEWVEKSLFFQAEIYGDFTGQNLWATLSFTMGNVIVEKLSLSGYWTVRDLTNLEHYTHLFSPQYSVVEVKLKYHMMPNMYWGLLVKLSGRISEHFDDDGNPIIATIPFIFLGIDYAFRF